MTIGWHSTTEEVAMTAPTVHRPAEHHRHTHGPGCGHTPVVHADHVDYLHDGHLHHEHLDSDGVHYDECSSCSDACGNCTCADCTCPTCQHAA
jgi:hypothetical protein